MEQIFILRGHCNSFFQVLILLEALVDQSSKFGSFFDGVSVNSSNGGDFLVELPKFMFCKCSWS
jgi:hypothetical protein